MWRIVAVSSAVLLCASAAWAAPVFADDFEAGLGAWTQVNAGSPMTWETDQAVSPTHSAKTTFSASRMYHDLGQEVSKPTFSVYIYDDTMTRSYAQMLSYTGAGYNQGSLDQLLAIGKYNSVTMAGEAYNATKYQARVFGGSNTGWFNLDGPGSPNRQTGWHKFTIEVMPDDSTVNFYVDDVLSRTITGVTAKAYDSLTLGFGTSSTSNGNSWYDDVVVTPEPATMALLAAGGLLLARRRRTA